MVGHTTTSAPTALSISNFSFDCLSVETQISLYPFTIAANARPIPVLPDVPSTIVPPFTNLPSFSASSTIFSAIRSLTELPGLKNSTLANTVASISLTILFNLTNGVLPIVSRILLAIFIDFFNKSRNLKVLRRNRLNYISYLPNKFKASLEVIIFFWNSPTMKQSIRPLSASFDLNFNTFLYSVKSPI